ncbi:MAG: hypothetical protein HGA25_10155, partial [Clostridiales bacterium]|nr:hypothetical protein [Clostridiales bacterium]
MILRKIYSQSLATKLRKNGFKLISVEPNPRKPEFDMYLFENTPLELITKFDLQDTDKKARELQRELKEIANISSFEPANIINKIINESNRR